MSEKKCFKVADSVLQRFVQIIQEAMLTGVDCVDIMRQVEMKPDESDPHVLVLSDDYIDMVRKQHESMLKFAEKQRDAKKLLEEAANSSGIIVGQFDK